MKPHNPVRVNMDLSVKAKRKPKIGEFITVRCPHCNRKITGELILLDFSDWIGKKKE